MALDAIKYISISRVLDKKTLVEHIPDRINKGFATEVCYAPSPLIVQRDHHQGTQRAIYYQQLVKICLEHELRQGACSQRCKRLHLSRYFVFYSCQALHIRIIRSRLGT